ncbi:serine hydrolase domain-containing protein [Mycobacterium sp. ITM-2016-00317]|uniref:esterase/beta-lactamase LipL n=1 Tax=Mycobacterium sp. ITM-2016-00317 TaxID=2099694 RepID=UPI00287FB432|nr:serine hydrolase domain-containing protein [Mycobacterium sp. ITM-2016-00317]WNG89946.1 serine hydrolase domain-containing protein [Mycobacterium sp. ITM-2016-00317]
MTGAMNPERDEALSHGQGATLPRGIQGAADPNFGWAVRAFAQMFPWRRLGGGALSVYLDGEPVVDVWTGWADRRGTRRWTADTAPMVFSATKGVAATVIHRLHDRGLIDYDAPVAQYWREFGANGKSAITVRDALRHRAGLSQLNGAARADLLDHLTMEERLAAAPISWLHGKPAYHAFTFGWLLSGLARSVTGKGMRELIRTEVAAPLNTDGLHLGRPPVQAPTQPAQIIGPQSQLQNPMFNLVAPRIAALPFSAAFGAMYLPGVKALVQGDTPLLDSEIPAANGVATARALARMYGAIANGGRIDGTQYLSSQTAAELIGRPSLRLDHSMVMPLSFHLGYHGLPLPGVMPGFGHVGLGGSLGWAEPHTGLAFGYVHNRLLTPLVVSDQAGFVTTAALIRRGAALARRNGYRPVREYGAGFDDATATAV